MTMSNLNVAAQTADAAIEHERKILDQIIHDETAAQRELDANQEAQKQALRDYEAAQQALRNTEQRISNYLGVKGRDRVAQEKRIRDAKEALNEQAEALLKTMANFGLEAPQPAAPQDTMPDPLGSDQVPLTEQSAAYNEQVAENGQPPTVTYPVPLAYFEDDPTEPADLGKPGTAPVQRRQSKAGK